MDIKAFAEPVSDDAPAGEDLEYDPAFLALEQAARGTPAHSIGDHETDAIPPDWRAVREQAEALFERTRDLRVAIYLANALLHLEGFVGLQAGLELIRDLSDTLWDSVFPQLDEDDGDPIMRCNAVRDLVNREMMLAGVLEAPFVSSRMAGRFSLRDLKVIAGELKHKPDDGRPEPQRQLIDAAFQDVDAQENESVAAAISSCVALVGEIEARYQEKVGAVEAPDLSDLSRDLVEIEKFVAQQLRQLGLGDASASAADVESGAQSGGGSAGPAAAISGEVNSRDDVVRMIDKICAYYERQEPSSPVPLLLRRASSLVHKSFMEILADLTPSGVPEAQGFAGDSSSPDSGAGWGDSDGVESKDDSW